VLAYALNNYSYLLCEDRRYDEAAAAADEALEILRAVGDRWGATVTVGSLAVAELGAGRIDRARQLFAEQLTEAVACSATSAISEALEGLASIEARSGRLADAARLWGASEARLEDIGAISESAHDSSVDKERVRAELGAPTFQALHAEGASWAPDAAVEYALSLDRADVAAPSP
jgi:tetratricopeptide (TPR) repeat protein